MRPQGADRSAQKRVYLEPPSYIRMDAVEGQLTQLIVDVYLADHPEFRKLGCERKDSGSAVQRIRVPGQAGPIKARIVI